MNEVAKPDDQSKFPPQMAGLTFRSKKIEAFSQWNISCYLSMKWMRSFEGLVRITFEDRLRETFQTCLVDVGEDLELP